MTTKKIRFLLIGIACIHSLSHAVDPFYTNLLIEGKRQYQAGDYDDALESFRIAEFGLVDEKELVPELYCFYALTQYKKGAIGESRALLDRMETILGEEAAKKVVPPVELARDLSVMTRVLNQLKQPDAKPGWLPFYHLFYETWDLLKEKKVEAAGAKLKLMERMNGNQGMIYFLDGFLAFQKGDFKRCLNRLGKIDGPFPTEYGEDASFYLAFSYLKSGDLEKGERWAQKINEPDHIHQLMVLMEEMKGENRKN